MKGNLIFLQDFISLTTSKIRNVYIQNTIFPTVTLSFHLDSSAPDSNRKIS